MKIIIFLILLFPGLLFAQRESAGNGNEGGNGGDVVICENSMEKRTVLLDYYESNRYIEITGANDTFAKVMIILKRLAKHDPVRARLYEEGLNNFFAEAVFVDDEMLTEIHDEGWVRTHSRRTLGMTCIKQQVIIQFASPDSNENYHSWNTIWPNRYLIDKNIWDEMDETNQAGLIIHELLVREGVNLLGTTKTLNIRRLNRYWSSPSLIHDSTSEYEYKVQKLGFRILPR